MTGIVLIQPPAVVWNKTSICIKGLNNGVRMLLYCTTETSLAAAAAAAADVAAEIAHHSAPACVSVCVSVPVRLSVCLSVCLPVSSLAMCLVDSQRVRYMSSDYLNDADPGTTPGLDDVTDRCQCPAVRDEVSLTLSSDYVVESTIIRSITLDDVLCTPTRFSAIYDAPCFFFFFFFALLF